MADPHANRFYEDLPPEQADSEEEDDEDDEEEDEEDEVDSLDEDYAAYMESVRALTSNQPGTIIIDDESDDFVEEEVNKRRRTEGGEACSSLGIESSDSSQGYEWNRSDIDGLFCPICMEPWTDGGEHHICCLPCGHIYGMSCIQRWLQQRKNSRKCPQCNRKCALKDVRKLYASRLIAVDEESQKKIRSLEAKCATLESKASDWRKKEADCRKREAESLLKIQDLTERTTCLEQQLQHVLERQSESEHNFGSKFHEQGSCCNFELQKMFRLEGARVFDVDAANQILLVARKPRCIGGACLLTKMSLLSPHESEDITLPPATNCIRDLHISPSSSSLALYASLGKKLAVFSMESNNVVVTYDLQAPAWSCSWDLNSSHYIYAGLQNGSVYVFDIRQTARPLKFVNGFASNPVHTVLSLLQDSSLPSGVRTIISASAIGLCQWNIGDEGPFLVPETDNQGVCISLASCPSSDDIIISYRPKFDISTDVPLSQPLLTPHGRGVQGSHVLFKRVDDCFQKVGSSCANVNNIRLPKSVIIDTGNESTLFASEDEVTCELVLQELPSFRVIQRFKSPDHVRDVKYSPTLSHGLLGCLTERSLQLFSAKLS
ncbi:hypothetical protein L6164_009738 [Bauhinia variegata]|uniref:Uncharacterized protein n=1 Tax=Bauhinia variegata TaxID=167791 RepID=A0ACB9PKY0_BAUVA|nr:hypothetical protein L6164_009738 [Bauhinia variegata]